jgi:hypothetical protein
LGASCDRPNRLLAPLDGGLVFWVAVYVGLIVERQIPLSQTLDDVYDFLTRKGGHVRKAEGCVDISRPVVHVNDGELRVGLSSDSPMCGMTLYILMVFKNRLWKSPTFRKRGV